MNFIVWIRGLGRSWPQLWAELYWGLEGQRRDRVLCHFAIEPEDRDLPLDELALAYPPPPEPVDA
jgi:hypothetical protein